MYNRCWYQWCICGGGGEVDLIQGMVVLMCWCWYGAFRTTDDLVVMVWRISDQVRSGTGEDGVFVVVVIWCSWYRGGGGEINLLRERMGLIFWWWYGAFRTTDNLVRERMVFLWWWWYGVVGTEATVARSICYGRG